MTLNVISEDTDQIDVLAGDGLVVLPLVTIDAPLEWGITFHGDNLARIRGTVEATSPEADGVRLRGTSSVVVNFGEIIGDAAVQLGGSNLFVNNGQILGTGSGEHASGVFATSSSTFVNRESGFVDGLVNGITSSGSEVVNFGVIQGSDNGISLISSWTHVINLGVIQIEDRVDDGSGIPPPEGAGVDFAGGGSLINFGSIDDNSVSGNGVAGANRVINGGDIYGDVGLSNTNDLYFGPAGWVDDAIRGNGGEDVLFGGLYQDTLIGGQDADNLLGCVGADVLDGSEGNDVVTGGVGLDLFVFGVGSDSDTIVDFTNNRDTVQLESELVASGVTISISGGDLTVHFGTGDELTFTDFTNVAAFFNDVVLI